MNRHRTWVAAGMALVLLAAGCGRKAREERDEKRAEAIVSKAISMASGQKADVDIAGGTVKFTSEEGTVTVRGGEAAALDPAFPGDVPVYKGGKILHSANRNNEQFSVSLQTQDAPAAVAAYYRQVMPEQGWQPESTLETPNGTMLAYKKDARGANLMVMQGDEGTVVTIVIGSAD